MNRSFHFAVFFPFFFSFCVLWSSDASQIRNSVGISPGDVTTPHADGVSEGCVVTPAKVSEMGAATACAARQQWPHMFLAAAFALQAMSIRQMSTLL